MFNGSVGCSVGSFNGWIGCSEVLGAGEVGASEDRGGQVVGRLLRISTDSGQQPVASSQ